MAWSRFRMSGSQNLLFAYSYYLHTSHWNAIELETAGNQNRWNIVTMTVSCGMDSEKCEWMVVGIFSDNDNDLCNLYSVVEPHDTVLCK